MHTDDDGEQLRDVSLSTCFASTKRMLRPHIFLQRPVELAFRKLQEFHSIAKEHLREWHRQDLREKETFLPQVNLDGVPVVLTEAHFCRVLCIVLRDAN